jgi:hypothetical protein
MAGDTMTSTKGARPNQRGPAGVAALAVHTMSNTALTGATYDVDGGKQLVAARTAE